MVPGAQCTKEYAAHNWTTGPDENADSGTTSTCPPARNNPHQVRRYLVPNNFYFNNVETCLRGAETINDPYYFLKWWHRFTCTKEYPVKPERKIRQVKISGQVLIRKQCDSRSGVKGRTIRKRQGTLYKNKRYIIGD